MNVTKYLSKPKNKLPGVIFPGVAKCGTGTVQNLLKMSPFVKCIPGETIFFRWDYKKGKDYYINKVSVPAYPNQTVAENTVHYYDQPQVPPRIKAMNPDAKIMVILRDPIIRMVSHFVHDTVTHNRRWTGTLHEYFATRVASGYYDKNFAYWLPYYNLSQIQVVDGERLAEEPWAEGQFIFDFLNIPTRISKDDFYFNDTKGFYCIKERGCQGSDKGRKHPQIPQDIWKKYSEIYKPHILNLSKMCGRNFSWPSLSVEQ